MEWNKIYCGNCVDVMSKMEDNFVDLVITSPPYDDLRDYNEYEFDVLDIGKQLYRVIKDGGVLVWVVGDASKDGSETGTSFKQALCLKDECGFSLHDTMIYQKNGIGMPNPKRYHQCFEYMFVFSKGTPKTANLIKDRRNSRKNEVKSGRSKRQKNGKVKKSDAKYTIFEYGTRWNIWTYEVGYNKTTKDKVAFDHPAVFPEKLAEDHILTWSNEGDIVMDIMSGSGTTIKMAKKNNRKYIGIEISEKYCKIAEERISIIETELKNKDILDVFFKKQNDI